MKALPTLLEPLALCYMISSASSLHQVRNLGFNSIPHTGPYWSMKLSFLPEGSTLEVVAVVATVVVVVVDVVVVEVVDVVVVVVVFSDLGPVKCIHYEA